MHEVYFSAEARESIVKYFQENQEIIAYLKANAPQLLVKGRDSTLVKTTFNVRAIFHEALAKEVDINIVLFNVYSNVMRQPHTSRFLNSSLSTYYTHKTIFDSVIPQLVAAKTKAEEQSKNTANMLAVPEISPYDTVKYSPYDNIIWPAMKEKPPYHDLGDRIVVLNSHNWNAKFGSLGTIIGVYRASIEVLFDQPFVGATDLCGRVPKFRGQMLKFFDVFNLSKWSRQILESTGEFSRLWDGDYNIIGLLELLREEAKKLH